MQYFVRDDENYEHLMDGRIYWESIFQLLVPDGAATMSARELSKPEKERIWEEIFRLKRMFFQEVNPDVVIHRVKYGIPIEARLARYRQQLDLPDYYIFSQGRLISCERK